jgi:hypothetical protein
LQLQATLTTDYVDFMRVHGASCCPKPKIVKCRFEDQDDAGTTLDEDEVNEVTAAAAPLQPLLAALPPRKWLPPPPAGGRLRLLHRTPALLKKRQGLARSLRITDAD